VAIFFEQYGYPAGIFQFHKGGYLYNFSLTLNKPFIGPFMLQLILTTKCNLKCKMCGVWKTHEEEIDTVYVKKAIDDAYKMGNLQQVYFTGGEVLMRPDIFRLIKYVKDHYPSVVTHLNTNGLLLTRDTINRLIDVGPTTLGVSIDSPVPAIHNFLRGEGVLEKVIESLVYINEQKERRGVKFPMVNTLSILMDQTLETMPEMIDFSVKYKFSGICIQPYVCNSDLRGEKKDIFLIKKERLPLLRQVLDKIEEKKKNVPLYVDIASDKIYSYFSDPVYVDKCYSGFTRALIVGRKICFVCNGPNNEEHQHFGEADRDSIDKVWFSARADFFRNTIKSCRMNCVQFCSIRPSSDSVIDINNRLKERNELFLLFREISFLQGYSLKYPELPLNEIIENDYLTVIRCLGDLLGSIKTVVSGRNDSSDLHFLDGDLEMLNSHLGQRDPVYKVVISGKPNAAHMDKTSAQQRIVFYGTVLQEYLDKRGQVRV
jgi:MoaA/NifB/PqqE/SkfB family radical SAM enzyme